MHRTIPLTWVFVAATLGSCSSSNDSGESPKPLIETLVLAGTSLATTAPCTVTSAYSDANGNTVVSVTAGSSQIRVTDFKGQMSAMTPFTFSASFTQTGHMATTTYTNASSGFAGTIAITNAGAPTWTASGGTGATVGTYTLTITKMTYLTTTANGTSYLIDGTLDATVPAVTATGATGTETVHATFVNN